MGAGDSSGNGRRNVLLLLVDDLKPALGCYGDPIAKSPNIDRLAAGGMRFDMAYCNQAVCAPSRNNLFLGMRSTSIGVYGLSRNFRKAIPDAVTMPQYFSRHGYESIAVGKTFHVGHGNEDDEASWTRPAIHEKVVEYHLPESTDGGQLTREEAYFSNQELGNIGSLPRGSAWEKADVDDETYADGRIAGHGIRLLREAAERPGKPFFLALGFVKPHLPFTAPAKYWDLYDPADFSLAGYTRPPKDAPPFAGKSGGEIVNYSPLNTDNLREESTQRQLIHGYYASLSYADAQIGKVLAALEQFGLEDNTVVVLWGDHGWHLGDHGIWTKHTNYEQCNRIPVIVRAPGVTKPGTASNHLVETVDLYPTIAGLAGLPAPEQIPQKIDGINLVPVLRDPSTILRDHAFHCYPRGGRLGRAIRTRRYRMVEWTPWNSRLQEEPVYELYDYQNDPNETVNLAESSPEVMNRLKAILATHPEPVKLQ